jgi:hypothetical protein
MTSYCERDLLFWRGGFCGVFAPDFVSFICEVGSYAYSVIVLSSADRDPGVRDICIPADPSPSFFLVVATTCSLHAAHRFQLHQAL